MNLFEVSKEISDRLTGIFLRDEQDGVRFTEVPRSSNPIPIGGTTCSSSNTSTGITVRWAPASDRLDGLVAKFIQLYGYLDASVPWKVADGGFQNVSGG